MGEDPCADLSSKIRLPRGNSLSGIFSYRLGHVTPWNPGGTKPAKSTEWTETREERVLRTRRTRLGTRKSRLGTVLVYLAHKKHLNHLGSP